MVLTMIDGKINNAIT